MWAKALRWIARHPGATLALARGSNLRDLILREDLRRMGIDLRREDARGLGESRLNVDVVRRLRARFEGAPPRTLIDVGAAHGGFSAAACIAFPDLARAYAFEPLPDVYETLARASAGRPQVRTFPFALGAREETARIGRSRNTGSSSLLRMLPAHAAAFPGTEVVSEEDVRVRTLDGVVRDKGLDLPRPVLMKIDVQGFEPEVLEGARETLPQTDALIVETSLELLYEGQELHEQIHARLVSEGFRQEGEFGRLVSPRDGRVVQTDALFRRVARKNSSRT